MKPDFHKLFPGSKIWNVTGLSQNFRWESEIVIRSTIFFFRFLHDLVTGRIRYVFEIIQQTRIKEVLKVIII
jgi:hypothetical protein